MVLFAAACGASHPMGDGGPGDGAATCTVTYRPNSLYRRDAVDLLLVVDDSADMLEEQARWSQQIPRLLRALASGDHDDDGVRETAPVTSLHVGVVTTDMGTGGHPIPSCGGPRGEDGVLRTAGNTSIPGCEASYPPFVRYEAGADDIELVARAVGCVARVGGGGCGVEQPLEAMLKAITPSTSGLTFEGGTVGHGDGGSAGFLRPSSVLVIVVLTNDRDCSASDPSLFDAASARYEGDLDTRCAGYPEALHAVERYVEGLSELRATRDGLVFAVLAGVPPDLGTWRRDRLAAVLDDERMQHRVDADGRTLHACRPPGGGARALPPRRLVATSVGLAESDLAVVLGSVCEPDHDAFLDALLERIALAVDPACLPRAPLRRPDGLIDCEMLEELAGLAAGAPSRCVEVPGRGEAPVGIAEDGSEICLVAQRPAGSTLPGWHFDDDSPSALEACRPPFAGRIVHAPGTGPTVGSRWRMRCVQPVGGRCDP